MSIDLSYSLRNVLSVFIFASAAVSLRAQDIYVPDALDNTISEYNAVTGAPIATPLIDNLSNPVGIAVSGDALFVANRGVSTVKEYNADTGGSMGGGPFGIVPVIPASSGLSYPGDILLDGEDLYVNNLASGTVGLFNVTNGQPVSSNPFITLPNSRYLALSSGDSLYVSTPGAVYEYDATTGGQIGLGPFLSGFQHASGIAIDDADSSLFVADQCAGTVTVYNDATGTEIGSNPLISGLKGITKLDYYQGDLYVLDTAEGSIYEFNATTGAQIGDGPLVSGLAHCTDDFFVSADPAVPEPATWSLLLAGIIACVFVQKRRARLASISVAGKRS